MASTSSNRTRTRRIGDFVTTYSKYRTKDYDTDGNYVDNKVHHIPDSYWATVHPKGKYVPSGVKIKIQADPSKTRRIVDIVQIPADGIGANIYRCPLASCHVTETRRDRVKGHVLRAHDDKLPPGVKWYSHPTCSWDPRRLRESGEPDDEVEGKLEEILEDSDEETDEPAASSVKRKASVSAESTSSLPPRKRVRIESPAQISSNRVEPSFGEQRFQQQNRGRQAARHPVQGAIGNMGTSNFTSDRFLADSRTGPSSTVQDNDLIRQRPAPPARMTEIPNPSHNEPRLTPSNPPHPLVSRPLPLPNYDPRPPSPRIPSVPPLSHPPPSPQSKPRLDPNANPKFGMINFNNMLPSELSFDRGSDSLNWAAAVPRGSIPNQTRFGVHSSVLESIAKQGAMQLAAKEGDEWYDPTRDDTGEYLRKRKELREYEAM